MTPSSCSCRAVTLHGHSSTVFSYTETYLFRHRPNLTFSPPFSSSSDRSFESPTKRLSMSSSHHAQVHVTRRSPSTSNVSKVHVKAPRSVPSSKSSAAPKITIKPAKDTKHPKHEDEDTTQDDEDDDMASSFLQFW